MKCQKISALLVVLCQWHVQWGRAWIGAQVGRTTSTGSARFIQRYNQDQTSSQDEQLRELYAPAPAIWNGTLKVDNIHTLYYEIYGKLNSPDGAKPLKALFLHGGPGAGCTPRHAQFFDPDRYQVILLDQRGSGRSVPRGEVRNNTLRLLIEDCESLRRHLSIDQWDLILGGSWGSTLAVAYGQTYPNSIRGMILRGVCLMRPEEINWLFASNGGCARGLPQAWESFEEAVGIRPDATAFYPRDALVAYYHKLLGSDEEERRRAARSWMTWEFFVSMSHKIPPSTNLSNRNETMEAINRWTFSESAVAVHTYEGNWNFQRGDGKRFPLSGLREYNVDPDIDIAVYLRQGLKPNDRSSLVQHYPFEFSWDSSTCAVDSSSLPAQNMLTCFYSVNDRYCMDNVNMLNMERMQNVRRVPCIAIQGGSDRICPPDTALDLLTVWPEMELCVPLRAGHSMYDPLITNELVRATDRFAHYLSRIS